MPKKNEELKRKKTNPKLTKKNYFIIIIPIVLILLITAIIAYYTFIYSNNYNKLKRYLTDNNYICNNDSCSINIDEVTEIIDLKTGILTVSNMDYTYMINKNYASYQDNKNELVCSYTSPKYEFYQKIDTSFTDGSNCEVYISKINKSIDKYQGIFESSNIDVNGFKN